MFGRLVGWYTIYTSLGFLSCNGILPGATFALRPSLALSYFGIVTSSGRQPNFAVLNRGRHLYSAGRPSRGHWSTIYLFLLWFLEVPSNLVYYFYVHVSVTMWHVSGVARPLSC